MTTATREIVRALVDDPHTSVDDVMIAVDVYALSAHVEACEEQEPVKPKFFWKNHDERVGLGRHCGDGWYCEKAQTYMFPVTDRED